METSSTPPSPTGVFRCGTLTYTQMGLVSLFAWLLWGDFCYVLMESVTPSLIPLKFKELHASNTQIGIITATIPTLIYIICAPFISFRSDRFRSKLGRRIPFILGSLPFLVLLLIGLAFGDHIAFWLHSRLGTAVAHLSPNEMAIYVVGGLLSLFSFFNTFVSTIFWYLFNDVVPEFILARFMSWFRTISVGSAAVYNFFVFPYAGTHYTTILVGAALLYLVGFGLLCLNVREGQYPPPAPYIGGKTGSLAAAATYLKETHSDRLYWYQWLGNIIGAIGGGAGGIGGNLSLTPFALLFYLAIGLSNAQIGYLFGTIGVTVGVLVLVTGWLADKYHPIRVAMVGTAIGVFIVTPANFIWLFWHFDQQTAFYINLFMAVFLMAPSIAMVGVYDPPLLMRLFPRSRYGQFCSVNAIWRSGGGMLSGILVGLFLDHLTKSVGKDRAYFFIPVWQFIFAVPSFILLVQIYRRWKQLGGDKGYVAPVLENKDEKADLVTLPPVGKEII